MGVAEVVIVVKSSTGIITDCYGLLSDFFLKIDYNLGFNAFLFHFSPV